jgi:hypothetical protein
MDWVSRIAEERIQEAIERGALRNLPGEGRPLEIEDLSHVPEDLRTAYIMLRNAGVVPEEVRLAKETVTLADMLRMCRTDEERADIRKKLNERRLRLRLLMEQRGWYGAAAWDKYGERIEKRLGGEDA